MDELEQQVKKGFDGIYSGDEAALVNAEKAIANKRTILLANPFLDGDKVLAARFKLGVNAHKAMAPDLVRRVITGATKSPPADGIRRRYCGVE